MPRDGDRSLTREQHAEIIRLRGEGLSWNAIARATAIPRSTVVRYAAQEPQPDPSTVWDLDQQPFGPEEHAAAKRALGLKSVRDLLVLSSQHDPFYCGTPAQVRDARWYGRLWRDLGMTDGDHTRQVHYLADAVGALKPDGTRYTNCEADWRMLLDASAPARYLGDLDAEVVADKRNRAVSDNVTACGPDDGTPAVGLADLDGDEWGGWEQPRVRLPADLDMPLAEVTGYSYAHADDPVLVEVWAEKSTMDDILSPLCDRLGVNYLPGTGYESITRMVEFLRRAEAHPSRRGVVLYVSDHDGPGRNMPFQTARQVQFWAARRGIDAEIFVHPVVLTAEQVARYGLPKAPDSGATELDALQALHPGELAGIVEAEVGRWRDPDLADALDGAERQAQDQADDAWEQASEGLSGELEAIQAEAQAILADYQPMITELNRRLAEGPGRRLDALAQQVRDRAASVDWNLPARPEAEDPEALEDRDGLLYDSDRHWLAQIQAYRAHRGQPPLNLDGLAGDGGPE
jgi:hypothetical protein